LSDPKSNVAGLPREVVDAALASTAEQVKRLVPSDTSASIFQYGGSVLRAFIAFEAGQHVDWALNVSGDEANLIGGILAVLAVVGWGLVKEKWAAWRTNQVARASAAASAQATAIAGVPTAVPLEPPPNKI